MCSYTILSMPCETSKDQKAFLFLFYFIFLIKNVNYTTKDASILHLKLAGNIRSSYFMTSTFQNTPHFTMAHLLQAVGCWDKKILTPSLC